MMCFNGIWWWCTSDDNKVSFLRNSFTKHAPQFNKRCVQKQLTIFLLHLQNLLNASWCVQGNLWMGHLTVIKLPVYETSGTKKPITTCITKFYSLLSGFHGDQTKRHDRLKKASESKVASFILYTHAHVCDVYVWIVHMLISLLLCAVKNVKTDTVVSFCPAAPSYAKTVIVSHNHAFSVV